MEGRRYAYIDGEKSSGKTIQSTLRKSDWVDMRHFPSAVHGGSWSAQMNHCAGAKMALSR